MKIIDLYNKIANGEIKDKTKFRINWGDMHRDFYYDDSEENQLQCLKNCSDNCSLYDDIRLNDEVEILEEEKLDNFTGLKVYKDGIVISSMDWTKEKKKIPEKINISNFPRNNNSLKKTAIKVNEIIDFFKFLI